MCWVAGYRRWVVGLDLEKFLDRVNHDVLMARVSRQEQDRRVLQLIRRFLEAGMMADGLVGTRRQGTPQGGPLSPLLSNTLFTDLDRHLEARGLAFCRYADDCNIYVGNRRAGERVMANTRAYLEKALRLAVNEAKSEVAKPGIRKFLGYRIATRLEEAYVRIAPQSIERLMQRVRELMRQGRGQSLARTIQRLNPLLRGWANYFSPSVQHKRMKNLDGWLRRRLRCLLWRQWKRPRTCERHLLAQGLDPERAWRSSVNGREPWWNASASHMQQAFPNVWFQRLGLVSIHVHTHAENLHAV